MGDRTITTLGFDADDTLWQNEQFFRLTQNRFADLLAHHGDAGVVHDRLLAAERRNLGSYGFGIKGFTLSMIETALDVSEGTISPAIIREILEAGREMLAHPVETLAGVRETLETLSADYRLVLITKGDLFDQERKLAQSGLGELFSAVEIVSDKTVQTYKTAFDRHGDGPARALMAGNSMRSDILPALEAGAFAVYVPHDLTWIYEKADAPQSHARYFTRNALSDLPALLETLA